MPHEYLPHQQRVLLERAELDEKIKGLGAFISSQVFTDQVNDEEKGRLHRQHAAMMFYIQILDERIAVFRVTPAAHVAHVWVLSASLGGQVCLVCGAAYGTRRGGRSCEAVECKIPPPGWNCSRPAGHEGPCAARQDNPLEPLQSNVTLGEFSRSHSRCQNKDPVNGEQCFLARGHAGHCKEGQW